MYHRGMKLPLFVFSLLFAVSFFTVPLHARENVTEWYVKDFQAEFVMAPDSTMLVTERILADCGQCVGKHGIFRVMPLIATTPDGDIRTPVELVSITDFSGQPHPFETIANHGDQTVTWKIGDPDVTVTGEHEYQIVYQVKNVIRDQGDFHEWYWNVLGNFWDMPIDTYAATVRFPGPADRVSTYSGPSGMTDNQAAALSWVDDRTLRIDTDRSLAPKNGITVSVSFPTTVFVPYQFSLMERLAWYTIYLWFLIPLIALAYLYRMWRQHGDDPGWDKPIIAEYELPHELTPLSAGALLKNGSVDSRAVTAAIIGLAVQGFIRIRQETTKILFFKSANPILERLNPEPPITLSTTERTLLDRVFSGGASVALADLRYKLHPVLAELGKTETKQLIKSGYFEKSGFTYRSIFLGIGIVGVFTFVFFSGLGWTAPTALALTWLLFVVFGAIMPKRTTLGVELHAKLQGLKLYMAKAEEYRQQFHEREGSFEKLLPVAILFGMTKEWIRKMEALYGKEYLANYHPAWFVGSDIGNFDVGSFTSHMESISSAIAATTGTRSGSGGSGSSGGGGGGGGGGGW